MIKKIFHIFSIYIVIIKCKTKSIAIKNKYVILNIARIYFDLGKRIDDSI